MVPWWTIPIALFVGAFIGMMLMALCVAGDDERTGKKESADVPAPTDK